jgi:hypothetical protein
MPSKQNKKRSTEVVISDSEYDSDASSIIKTDAETEDDYDDDESSMEPDSQPESVNSIPVKIKTHSTSRGRSSSSKRYHDKPTPTNEGRRYTEADLADGLGSNKDRFRAGLPLIGDKEDVREGKDKARREKDEKKGKKKRARSSSPADDKTQKKRQMAKVVSTPEGVEVDLSHSTRLPYKSYNLGFNYKMHTSRYVQIIVLSQHN